MLTISVSNSVTQLVFWAAFTA